MIIARLEAKTGEIMMITFQCCYNSATPGSGGCWNNYAKDININLQANRYISHAIAKILARPIEESGRRELDVELKHADQGRYVGKCPPLLIRSGGHGSQYGYEQEFQFILYFDSTGGECKREYLAIR